MVRDRPTRDARDELHDAQLTPQQLQRHPTQLMGSGDGRSDALSAKPRSIGAVAGETRGSSDDEKETKGS